MVCVGKGRLFRRKDGKFLIYLPKDLCEDGMFPLKVENSMVVNVSFELGGKTLLVEKAEEAKTEWSLSEQPQV